jgi:RNA polymerase sigma-70 factor (ECF subfamily)
MELERVAVGASSQVVVGLYDANQADLHGYALAVTHDADSAEDVVQESFLRLVRQHQAGRPPDDPRAWLFRVATNLIRSGFRRRSVAERYQPVMRETGTAESAESSAMRSEDHRALAEALARLPVDVRTALMLSAEGYTGREVAQILGKREGATRSLMWRGRVELRRLLDGEGDR